MSQKIIFEIIQSSGGEITRRDIKEELQKNHPDRSLDAYLSNRLNSLTEKGAVSRNTKGNLTTYSINEDSKFSSDTLSASIADLSHETSLSELKERGIEISNIVITGSLDTQIDLEAFAITHPGIQYEPETSPMAVWRPFPDDSRTVLIPSSGKITILGSKNEEEVSEVIEEIYEVLPEFTRDEIDEYIGAKLEVHNIVATTSLNRELDLEALAVGLGLGRTEYDPDSFPGIVYRLDSAATALIFRSGKVVITASNTYSKLLSSYQELIEDLSDVGVDLNF